MSNVTTLSSRDLSAKIEAVLMGGDLSSLNEVERVQYHNKVCESVGLNPLTAPFAYIKLNGKLVLYAKRDATDQLRKVHNVSVTITSRDKFDDIYVVTAKAKDATGREDESTGAVNLAGLSGDNLANALMKAETKAKRRVTLSICGLGLLDETEAEPLGEKPVNEQQLTAEKIVEDIRNVAENKPLKNFAPQSNPLKQPDDLGEYKVPMGQFKGKKLSEIDRDELANYVAKLYEAAARGAKSNKQGEELMKVADEYLNDIVDAEFSKPGIDENEELPHG